MDSFVSLSISALGVFQITRNGHAAPKFKYLDARELLVYLLISSEHAPGKSKQEIAAALWGDVSDAQLNARFKARLNDLRRVLGAREWIVFADEAYHFEFAPRVFFDVREFQLCCADAETARRAENLFAERDALQRALTLYRGDFLQDYHTRRSRREALGEREWYLSAREELQNKYRRVLERAAQIEMDAAQSDAAIELLRQLIALDEYDDAAHYQLMLALTQQGKRSQALRHYQNLLQTRGDVLPDAELVALFEKIKRNETTSARQTPASPFDTATTKTKTNLPIQPTSFVGRERELQDIRSMLGKTHLLTLTGAGGSGKTRLSLQAAAEVMGAFEKGAWFVELAPIAEAALVPNAALNALGLRDEAGRAPLEILTDYLGAKELLLILDNCEHLVHACAQLAQQLLAHCPHLKILATSREALGIAGEVTYQVPPAARHSKYLCPVAVRAGAL